ncbi:twin-arginine translocation signal domain-containing protein [Bacteroidota bacterium]
MVNNFNRRNFLKKASLAGLVIGAAPGFALEIIDQQVTGQQKRNKIITGGFNPNDPKYGIRISPEEIDRVYRMKNGLEFGYGVFDPYSRPNNISDWEYLTLLG